MSTASRHRRRQLECSVWPVRVVVVDVDAQDALELPAADDQEPVEAVAADRSNPAFGEGVRPRRPERRADDLDTFALEDVVERVAEFHEGGPPRRADSARRNKVQAEEAYSCCTLDWISV